MYDSPIPAGLASIEDWVLQCLYNHPSDKHSTSTLLQQLDQVLRDEPSQLEECNRIRQIMGASPLSPEQYAAERKPTRAAVQKAVEALVREGWANGKRKSDTEGVFFEELDLTSKGMRKALAQADDRARRENPAPSFESIVRKIHEQLREESK